MPPPPHNSAPAPGDAASLAREAIDHCYQLGFAAAGISDAAPTRYGRELCQWLAAGKHSSMGYLERNLAARLDPTLVLKDVRSMIVVADLYAARGDVDEARALGRPASGCIARYARGRDYHPVMKKRLHALADALRLRFPEAGFRAVVDTAPVLEREYAARAGVGWTGKHTLTIHPRLGSYILLGCLLTTLDLPAPAEQQTVEDHCGTCTRCIDACPTSAITPSSVDASRCISYLTIERRGLIPDALHEPIGTWIYGCDICQEVCPHNSPRPAGKPVGTVHQAYASGRGRSSLPLLEVLGWNPADRARAFEGSAMKRATLAMMKRNALIVAGNILDDEAPPPQDQALRQRISEIAADEGEDPLVRQTAAQVLGRLAR